MALAEKIDKLTGFWAIDEKPTGSKDPFALRRAALGVIRILVENKIHLSVVNLVLRAMGDPEGEFAPELRVVALNTSADGRAIFASEDEEKAGAIPPAMIEAIEFADGIPTSVLSFLHDRLKVYLKDQGVRHDIIDACIAMPQNDDLTLLVKRAKALSETLKTDDGENLIQGFKRANNILSQAEDADGVEYSFGADIKFAETEEERALFAALDTAEAQIKPAMEAQDFGTAMSAMASLRGPIDAFFDAVQVNSDNATVRRNRLNLLSRIRTICSSVADLTKIDG